MNNNVQNLKVLRHCVLVQYICDIIDLKTIVFTTKSTF